MSSRAFTVIVKTDGSFAALIAGARTMPTAIRSTPAAWAGMAKCTDMETTLFPIHAMCARVKMGRNISADPAMTIS